MTTTTVTTATRDQLTSLGYLVIPICAATCKCASPGKRPHITGWESRALFTEVEWSRHPNIGVRTDYPLLVIDCDQKSDGDGVAQLTQLFSDHDDELPEPTQLTGGGGVHYWYRLGEDAQPLGNSAGKLGSAIDTRGAGGQVVVAPSAHHSGLQYRWVYGELPPALDQLPLLPFWCEAMLRDPTPTPPPRPTPPTGPPTSTVYAGDDEDTGRDTIVNRWLTALDQLTPNTDNNRNTTLFRAGCALFNLVQAGRLDDQWVRSELRSRGAALGLPESGVEASIESASGRAVALTRPEPQRRRGSVDRAGQQRRKRKRGGGGGGGRFSATPASVPIPDITPEAEVEPPEIAPIAAAGAPSAPPIASSSVPTPPRPRSRPRVSLEAAAIDDGCNTVCRHPVSRRHYCAPLGGRPIAGRALDPALLEVSE